MVELRWLQTNPFEPAKLQYRWITVNLQGQPTGNWSSWKTVPVVKDEPSPDD